jgi:hypothetical protein
MSYLLLLVLPSQLWLPNAIIATTTYFMVMVALMTITIIVNVVGVSFMVMVT